MNRKQKEDKFHTVLLELKDIGVIVQNPDTSDMFGLSTKFKSKFDVKDYDEIDGHKIIRILIKYFHIYDAKACAEYTRILMEMFKIEKEMFQRMYSDESRERYK